MTPRLRIEGACKRYGGVHALSGVDLSVAAGEVHALLGENGAGKSTLMKILAGAVRADAGTMELDGEAYEPSGPKAARASGVAMIYQELNLCPDLTVLANVTLGEEAARFGWLQQRDARARLGRILGRLGVTSFDAGSRVANLGPGERQLVEIARALFANAKVIVFDEPTSSLSPPDVARLFDVARGLAAENVSVVWISHFLDEVEALCDRFTVLRDGESVGSGVVADTTIDEMVAKMVGRSLDEVYPRSERVAGETVLSVKSLRGARGLPRDASFDLQGGEILGIFGLVGAGRTELLRCLFGLDERDGGEVRLQGQTVPAPCGPREWLLRGVGLLSEDRAHEGLAVDLSLADNVTLSALSGALSKTSPRERAKGYDAWREPLAIRADRAGQPARSLSGGNQQKVAIARLLHHGVDVFLLDEPTRGIDIGAKIEVYRLLDQLAASGKAVLVVSSYLPELFGIADRIAVMHRGVLGPARATGELNEEGVILESAQGQELSHV